VIVDCAHYKDGTRQHAGQLSVEEAARRCRESGFVWIGLHDPEPDELYELAERFELPELAVEDAMKAHQRPKVEDYEKGYFMVLHSARYLDDVEEVEFGEIHVFTGPGYVIVVRHGAASELRAARERLEHRPDLLEAGPLAAVWAVMDKVVDDYEPVIAGLENDVEEVEQAVFEGYEDESKRIYFLRRELSAFYRAVHPLLAPVEAFEHGSRSNEVGSVLRNHLRDVADHLKRLEDEIATQRDMLSNILQANLAVIGVHQNDVVRKISGWAGIIAVPTFISGLYGMNFEHMPELRWEYGYPLALTLMFGVSFSLWRYLRRVDWL
jgi:magnesium transporter